MESQKYRQNNYSTTRKHGAKAGSNEKQETANTTNRKTIYKQ